MITTEHILGIIQIFRDFNCINVILIRIIVQFRMLQMDMILIDFIEEHYNR